MHPTKKNLLAKGTSSGDSSYPMGLNSISPKNRLLQYMVLVLNTTVYDVKALTKLNIMYS